MCLALTDGASLRPGCDGRVVPVVRSAIVTTGAGAAGPKPWTTLLVRSVEHLCLIHTDISRLAYITDGDNLLRFLGELFLSLLAPANPLIVVVAEDPVTALAVLIVHHVTSNCVCHYTYIRPTHTYRNKQTNKQTNRTHTAK